jgi:hypothetical protein
LTAKDIAVGKNASITKNTYGEVLLSSVPSLLQKQGQEQGITDGEPEETNPKSSFPMPGVAKARRSLTW